MMMAESIASLAIVLALLAFVLFVAVYPMVGRAIKYRKMMNQSWNSKPADIEGFGTVHIQPMPAALQLALLAAMQTTEKITLYAWIISNCVDELKGRSPHAISMELSPVVIDRLGEAVLDVAGLTEKGKEEAQKKSENRPS